MSFRDLRLFSKALLAKPAWQLFKNPDFLCAKSMTTKYYPHGHLLDMAFTQSTLVTWKGIMHVIELF